MSSDYARQLTRENAASRCTDRVRAVMSLANVAARSACQEKINSLHILTGLFYEGKSWASLCLQLTELDMSKLLAASVGGRFDTADAVFDRACKISSQQAVGYIGTDHLLLAILDGDDSLCETMSIAGVNVRKLREANQRAMGPFFPACITQIEESVSAPFDRDKACRQFVDGLLLRMSRDKCQPIDVHGPLLGQVAVERLCKLAEVLKANGESWEEYT